MIAESAFPVKKGACAALPRRKFSRKKELTLFFCVLYLKGNQKGREPMARAALVSFFDEWSPSLRQLAASLSAEGHDVLLVFLRTHYEIMSHPVSDEPSDRVFPPRFRVSGRELDLLLEVLEEFRPAFAGMTVMSPTEELAIAVTERIRRDLSVPVVWGGSSPTMDPARAERYADVVCVGEGEKAVVGLARIADLAGGRRGLDVFSTVRGPVQNLRIRTAEGWLRGEEGFMVEDLDGLPFPLVDPECEVYVTEGRLVRGEYPSSCRVPVSLPAVSTRGCPCRCSYCNHGVQRKIYRGSRYVRRRSPENFVEELRERKRRFPHLSLIEMCDPIFAIDDSWCIRFADLYEKHVALPFICYAYPGSVRKTTLRRLREAGLQSIMFGIQTGSERTLRDVFHRPTPKARILETARLFHDLAIPYAVEMIGSNPFESDEDRLETVRLLADLPKPYFLRPVQPLQFYQGYPITERAQRERVPLTPWQGNAWVARPETRYRSWDALMVLAQFSEITGEDLETLSSNDALMDNPRVLEDLAEALTEGTYLKGNICDSEGNRVEEQVSVTKDSRIRQLEGELGTLRGSRLVRGAILLRDALRGDRYPPRGGKRVPAFL
jgi:radical SAM superfamily enzyme YgiQ (UPF0313 family)